MALGFQIVQIVYWLGLSTWFGGVLFVALSAPIVFRTVRERDPVLTNVLSVNLQGQHATLLAGSIVGNILARLSQIGLICGGVLLVDTMLQFVVANTAERNLYVAMLRVVLCAAATGIAAYDRFLIWPRIVRYRDEYVEHADEPEVANPAKDSFDREHRRSMTLLMVMLGLLLLLILYGSNVTPAAPEGTAAQPAPVNRSGG